MPGLALNEDADHFFFDRSPEKMTVEGLRELIDHYAVPQMKEIFLNVNSMRASYRSRVWTSYWDGFDPNQGNDQPFFASWPAGEREAVRKGVNNARLLDERGIDLFKVWIDRVRQHGISPWLSMRMNDVHSVDNVDAWCHTDFWRNHPEYRRAPYRFEAWPDRAYDYGRKEVRDYHFALIEEIFDRYDFDGLELDWMRFGFHFRPGFEAEGREILMDFHRRVRALADAQAKRRGHPIRIGVRAPSRPQTARELGLDAAAWAKAYLVDYIVITPFWATIEFDMPVELWKELLGDSPAILAAGLELNLRPTPRVWPKYGGHMSNSAETVFGAAASLLHRGADRIYLFNYMDTCTTVDNPEDYPKILHGAGTLQTATAGSRRHVVTYPDTWAPGEPDSHLLPAECRQGRTAAFRIPIGPKPAGGTAQVYVGLGENGGLDTAALEVRVNGQLCSPTTAAVPSPVHPIVQKSAGFDVPPGILHDGYNVVEVTGKLERAQEIVWMEIMIRS
jgi:hypothetical protein